MTLSIFSNFATLLSGNEISISLVQPLNILNECTLGVEKYVRNVVDDVVNSHGVVVMNALSML